jgi:hypothetical protein
MKSRKPAAACAAALQKFFDTRQLAFATGTRRSTPLVIPAKAGLRRQDAVANIGVADGPKGEPQDAASNPATF